MLTPIQDGVLGFVRSIADWYFQSETIRVNAICPSSVKTELLPEEAWDSFDPLFLTSMDLIVKVVLEHFLDGEPLVDFSGCKRICNYGQTVIPSEEDLYLSDPPVFVNARHEAVVMAAAVDKQTNII